MYRLVVKVRVRTFAIGRGSKPALLGPEFAPSARLWARPPKKPGEHRKKSAGKWRKIDKTFLIAKPMRKSRLNEAVRRGMGDCGRANADRLGLSGPFNQPRPAKMSEKPLPAAYTQRYRGRVFWGLKTRYKRFVIGVSVYFPVGVMGPPTGDIRRAAASGNCQSVDIVVTPRQGWALR